MDSICKVHLVQGLEVISPLIDLDDLVFLDMLDTGQVSQTLGQSMNSLLRL